MVSESQGRAAARAAAAILVVAAGFQFYWALGGTWAGGLELEGYDRIDRAIVGLLCLVYAGVLLVRVGYWREHMPSGIARVAGAKATSTWPSVADLNAWLIVLVPVGGALQAFAQSDPVGGLIDLLVAALAFVVVRSERPVSPARGAAPRPSGRAGPSSSAH
jgi:hypothetical protein